MHLICIVSCFPRTKSQMHFHKQCKFCARLIHGILQKCTIYQIRSEFYISDWNIQHSTDADNNKGEILPRVHCKHNILLFHLVLGVCFYFTVCALRQTAMVGEVCLRTWHLCRFPATHVDATSCTNETLGRQE